MLSIRRVVTRCIARPSFSSALSQQLHGLMLMSADAPASSSNARKGSNVGRLAALALGGAVTGVVVQQLFLRPTPLPQVREADPSGAERPASRMEPADTHAAAAAAGPAEHVPSSTSEQHQPVPPDLVVLGISQEQRQPASTDGKLQGPWVVDEEMEMVIHRRAVTKNRLMAYISSMQQRMYQLANEAQMMGKRGEAWFQERMKELEGAVDLQAQIILFGVHEPNARRRHLERYGCSKWTDESLAVIKGFAPIIEIGAGHGHWQHALAQQGVDVVAFDNQSALPMEGMPNVGVVQKGDETELRKHRRRTLLLVYPGPDDMGCACLKEYKGNYLLYVGEQRGGVNGTPEFFDKLEAEWEVEQVTALDPFPDGFEKLYVLRRKGVKAKGKGWW